MSFPQANAETITPIFTTYCIDYRYDSLSSDFLNAIGYANSYYVGTNAGAALALSYDKTCDTINCQSSKAPSKTCCNGRHYMHDLKKSFVTNLEIALTLKPITVVYLLNHQDCGAIRAFLPCSGYPADGASDKNTEICINAKILASAQKFVTKKFENMQVILGLIDSNGSVADYDAKTKKWNVIYVGAGQNTNALWYGYKLGQILKFKCNCNCEKKKH